MFKILWWDKYISDGTSKRQLALVIRSVNVEP